MKKKRFSVQQIIKILREAESGLKVADLTRKYGIVEQTFYRWKKKYGDMSPTDAKRRAVNHLLKKMKCSIKRACRVVQLNVSTYYYKPVEIALVQQLIREIKNLAVKHPRYGYRMICAKLRQAGWAVNRKRIQRLMRIEGLKVTWKLHKRRRVGTSTTKRRKATHWKHVWSWDFIFDRTEDGRQLKFLVVLDNTPENV